jgi:hypothetical protein
MKFNWTCPHCHHPQVVTDDNFHENRYRLVVGELDIGSVGVRVRATGCLNGKCRKLTLFAFLEQWDLRTGKPVPAPVQTWRLMPQSSAVPQPDYIPVPIVESYYEACLIRDLSPKASATLARRCLQGMIRDFAKIAKGTLDAEIKELRSDIEQGDAPAGVTPESVEGIDQVRSIGNIGAHMEKDIDLIVDVDPGEAQALIELIEMLLDEWYVARHHRQQRLASIAAIAADKKAKIAEAKAQKAAQEAGEEPKVVAEVTVQTPEVIGTAIE